MGLGLGDLGGGDLGEVADGRGWGDLRGGEIRVLGVGGGDGIATAAARGSEGLLSGGGGGVLRHCGGFLLGLDKIVKVRWSGVDGELAEGGRKGSGAEERGVSFGPRN